MANWDDDNEPFILEPPPEITQAPEAYPGHLNHFIPSPVRSFNANRNKRRAQRKGENGSKRRKNTENGSNAGSCGEISAMGDMLPTIDECEAPMAYTNPVNDENPFAPEPLAEDMDQDDAYQEFICLVEDQCISFVHVATRVYVVEGFDERKKEGTGIFYHFEARKRGNSLDLVCQCPAGKDICVHRRFYEEFREARFAAQEAHLDLGEPYKQGDHRSRANLQSKDGDVVCFARIQIDTEKDVWISRFSVAGGTASDTGRSRAIVTFEGIASGAGKWQCSKDRDLHGAECAHMTRAKKLLDLITGNTGSEVGEDNIGDRMYMVDGMNAGGNSERSVSYLPIMPPPWALLPEDEILYPYPSPNADVPGLLALDERSRSFCGEHFFSPLAPKLQKDCTVYTLTHTMPRKVELQWCPSCPRRRQCFIGPEPCDLGLFNYNNSVMFTHELMNELTSRYTSSETPFTAFVQAVDRLYTSRGCRFVGEDLFRSAWFAFATNQELKNDMSCSECGVHPKTVIWDGVTISFAKRHLKDTLQPPTCITENAPRRKRTRVHKQQWLPHSNDKTTPVRKLLVNWLRKWGDKKASESMSKAPNVDVEASSEEEDFDLSAKDSAISETTRREGELQEVQRRLVETGAAPVRELLAEVYGAGGNSLHWRLRKRYKMLLEQIGAEESVLQMVNEKGLRALKAFVECPDANSISLLTDIPVLMMILEYLSHNQKSLVSLVALSKWMIQRVEAVLSQLKNRYDVPLQKLPMGEVTTEDWRKDAVTAFRKSAIVLHIRTSLVTQNLKKM
ncbi:hypothetical protein VNI00_017667 [Paramarasmius palmivorus]|uniref:HMG domain-containing protein n=1 Tax=Paramarasmius palmivorus TaxID=297713 RepID=A0AAW0B4K4_9AGAR